MKRKIAQPEADNQAAYFKIIDKIYVPRYPRLSRIYAVPNGRFRNIQTAMKLKREGVRSGVPDICIPLRGAAGESGAYIEMKHGKNTCSPDQEAYLTGLQEEGYSTTVAYSWESALLFTIQYLGLPKLWT